nr:MAG TPA: hypothetical protein [Caudoviricetes sp.]
MCWCFILFHESQVCHAPGNSMKSRTLTSYDP